MEDVELLLTWRQGDKSAGEELIKRHYRTVFDFFFHKVGRNVQTAEDLAHSALMTLVEKRDDIQESFKGYMFGVARMKLIEHVRNRMKHRERFTPMEYSAVDIDPSLSAMFAGKKEEDLIVRALRSLDVDDQILLELKAYENLTAREIAEAFGVGGPAIGGKINRARERLRKKVEALTDSPELRDSTLRGLDSWIHSVRGKLATELRKQLEK